MDKQEQEIKQAEVNSKNAWDGWNEAWEEFEVAEVREKEAYIEREKADAELVANKEVKDD